MIYGYARCSTSEDRQDIDRQKRELIALGVDEHDIYSEYESGAKKDRPELKKLLNRLCMGDTLVVTEVSRLSRSTQQLCDIVQLVQDRKIKLVIGSSFVVDCRDDLEIDPMTKGMLMMWSVFSEMERDMIKARVKSGMQNAKAKGVQIGRPTKNIDNLPKEFWKAKGLVDAGHITKKDAALMCGVERATFYAWLRIAEESSCIKKGKKG